MENIRAGRAKPGLKLQHVHALKSLLRLGGVSFTGASEGSSVVAFSPAPLKGADFRVDIGTAGSMTLLLQTLLPAVLLAEGASRVEVTGGTDVVWSPPMDYFRQVVLGVAGGRAETLRLEVVRRGFYPRGGGRIVLEGGGWKEGEPILRLEPGRLAGIRVSSFASRGLADRKVAERQAEAAVARLERHGVPVESEVSYGETLSPGSVVTCVARHEGGGALGGSALGALGKRAEEVGREAADWLGAEIASGAPVDEHAADQFVVWLAMAGGALRASRISEHTRTNLWVTERFLGKTFEVEGEVIRCIHPLRSRSRASG
jgi:RNA 3'-terminal phosphate cyclase (GTP)